MADNMDGIFTKKAADKLRSPDDLDEYLRGTSPSVWFALIACVLIMAGLLAWAFFGTATTNVSATGTYVDGGVVCFLSAEHVAEVQVGDPAKVDGTQMAVTSIKGIPLSRIEARAIVGNDYLANTLVQADWTYPVYLDGEGAGELAEGIPLPVSITIENVAPIRLVFRDAA